jgi:hypothetical protein
MRKINIKYTLTTAVLSSLFASAAFAVTPTVVGVVDPNIKIVSTDVKPMTIKPQVMQKVLEIKPNGSVLIRGTVSAVGSDSVTVKTWGGAWTVKVSSTTELITTDKTLSSIAVGDYVGVQGTISETADYTVDAKVLRNRTEKQMTLGVKIEDKLTADQKAKIESEIAAKKSQIDKEIQERKNSLEQELKDRRAQIEQELKKRLDDIRSKQTSSGTVQTGTVTQ